LKKTKYIISGFVLLLVFAYTGCKKQTTEKYPDKSYFYKADKVSHLTPYSLFQINDTIANPNITDYSINFYSDDVSYTVFNGKFVGWGDLVSLNINTSVFKSGVVQQAFNVDNLQEGTIKVESGTAYLGYDFNYKSAGSAINITGGTLTVWKYKDRYKINYKINLDDGSVIEGAYWDSMSVVYS